MIGIFSLIYAPFCEQRLTRCFPFSGYSFIPKLFEAFYRVDQSRNRQTGGTGLGLYIVKTILDLHRAAIEIEDICSFLWTTAYPLFSLFRVQLYHTGPAWIEFVLNMFFMWRWKGRQAFTLTALWCDISQEVSILGDLQLLQKVVDNLLGNAAAYSPAGECINVKLCQAAGKVNLMIENTGVHIPDPVLIASHLIEHTLKLPFDNGNRCF